jgi:hypothetical protein
MDRWRESTCVAVGLMILCLVGCGATEESGISAEERQYREQILKDDLEAEREFDLEQREASRYEDKVKRLSDAADQAFIKAERTRTNSDLRRYELARAREYIYREFKFDSNGYECPPEAPIKGNEPWGSSALIYHQPNWIYYGATIPEWCFKSEKQARRYGFRPSKVRR